MKPLAEYVSTNSRFSRSANIERDHGGSAINGYIPTGRAIDVIARVAGGLADSSVGRTFSITGPHGGGKSSLIVFLDSLLAASTTPEFKTAHAVLDSIDPAVDHRLRQAMRTVKGGRSGFIRAFATAANEPVAATIARALYSGAVQRLGKNQALVPALFGSAPTSVEASQVKDVAQRMATTHPLLLVIDEFGKNLEYFAASGSHGDPFLLQELAELTQGENALPLLIITLQHLSFDEYVQGSSTARRREWAKVQGRFQDIPYIETAAQSRRLITSAFNRTPDFRAAADEWLSSVRPILEEHGLRDIAEDASSAAPLHPLALAVLPDLCSRYGQNERTLFSFLAGSEPAALPQFLRDNAWQPGEPIPMAGLDMLYDYFLESSSSMIGVADGASRWIEIETRIRDTYGLTSPQLKALKAIGVMNLISSGGRIRASKALLSLALADDSRVDDVDQLLDSLVDKGLVTFRAFSDEYRVWQGSDYNLRRVVDNARHHLASASVLELLKCSFGLDPLIAGRHSQITGVLRVFGRQFSAVAAPENDFDPSWDGVVRYLAEPVEDIGSLSSSSDGRPVVYVVPQDISIVREAAIEAAALSSALQSAESEEADWVARRELSERLASSQHHLHNVVSAAWDANAEWVLAGSHDRVLDPTQGLSALLSQVADKAYPDTPHIANEMIARRELTSQGAKARRFLIDALLTHESSEAFGIGGYGPDRAIYEAVFRKPGIHRQTVSGEWALHDPTEASWKPLWNQMNTEFDSASQTRAELADIAANLALPPIGIKNGIIPLVLIAGLVRRKHEIAVYEHGSLVLDIDDAIAERLTKNISHFTIKNTMTRSGKRADVISSLVARLRIRSSVGERTPTFLNVATALFRELRVLPPYAQRTRQHLSPQAIAVREAFHHAAEPDVLIFETLPEILGFDSFTGRGKLSVEIADRYADTLANTLRELRDQYPNLLQTIQDDLAAATAAGGNLSELKRVLEADATRLAGHVLEPRLKAFVGALVRRLDDRAWLENVAMVVSEGQAPRVWTDDIANRFHLKVVELGGALRRTSALLHERLADRVKQGYSTSRMTLTLPDGTETFELLSLTTAQKQAVDGPFEQMIKDLTDGGLSRSAACRMLMARLAIEHEVGDERIQTRLMNEEDQRYG